MINTYAIYIEKLHPEYRTAFKQISDYVLANNMDQIKNEEILSEVMDTFLSAQSDGKTVEQTIGNNLKTFCEQLCSEISIKSRIINFFELLHPLFTMFTILCLFDLVGMISTISNGENISFMTYRAHGSLDAYLLGGAIWIISEYVSKSFIKKYIFSKPDKYKTLSIIIRGLTILVMLAVTVYIFRDSQSDGTYLWLSFLCCAVFMIVHRIITRDSRRYKKENRISMYDLANVSSNVTNDIEDIEMKRFEKLNKKKLRKGQEKLTFEQFLDYEEKQCNNWDKKPAFYAFMAVGGTVLGTVFTYFLGGFENTYDAIFFVGIMLAAEGAVMYGLFKIVDTGTKARIKWIDPKRGE